MKLSERIYSLRVRNSMTQKELSEIIGVSVVSIGCWENGTKNPSIESIIALSATFDVSVDYLLGVAAGTGHDDVLLNKEERDLLHNYQALDSHGRKLVDTICRIEAKRVTSERLTSVTQSVIMPVGKPSARYIPRYTTPSAAGLSVPLDGDDFEMILVDETVPYNADFAVGIQGNSMYPYIKDGDTVFVKKDTELSVGEIGIFCVNGMMYCKQYFVDEAGNLALVSANEELKHTNVYIEADSDIDVKCYGKVLLGFRVDLPSYILNK